MKECQCYFRPNWISLYVQKHCWNILQYVFFCVLKEINTEIPNILGDKMFYDKCYKFYHYLLTIMSFLYDFFSDNCESKYICYIHQRSKGQYKSFRK